MSRRHREATLAAMTTKPPPAAATSAFYAQAVISFGISLLAAATAMWHVPADGWVRAFLALSLLYVTTSAFTLAKVVRDRQETSTVLSRVDQARLERLLAEHNPYAPESVS
jgi:hypothetical protein